MDFSDEENFPDESIVHNKMSSHNQSDNHKINLDNSNNHDLTTLSDNTIDDNIRYAILPIKNDDTWDYVLKSYAMYWVAEEIQRDLHSDIDDLKTLNEGEKRLLFKTLSFFATGDYIVNQNLNTSFYEDVEALGNLEAVHFYDYQRMIENVHSRTYSMLLEEYVKDNKLRQQLIDGIKHDPFIKKKAEWCLTHFGCNDEFQRLPKNIQQLLLNEKELKSKELSQWIKDSSSRPSKTFAERLIAQACTELISFSGSFCIVFWFAKQNRFKGLKKANQLISRDEGIHGIFACHMYQKLGSPLSKEKVKNMIIDFVDIEVEYIKSILPNNLLGMNAELMTQYIKFMANYLIKNLGYDTLYPNIANPFDFMEQISISVRSGDFFKKENVEYAKANAGISKEDQELDFA